MAQQLAQRSGLDRRTLIKRGAAAGAIAWTVPTVLATHAQALTGTACTPKCAPNATLEVDPTTFLYCNTSGQKWARLRFTWDSGESGVCACGPGDVVLLGSQVTPNPSEVKDVILNPEGAENTADVIIGGQGTGALGNGTYTATIAFCVECADQTGDLISKSVAVQIQFTFQPANGPCSQDENVGAAQIVGTTVGEDECAACPQPS